MNVMLRVCLRTCLGLSLSGLFVASALAEPYELSKNDVMDPKAIKSPDVSLFGVKIGDAEARPCSFFWWINGSRLVLWRASVYKTVKWI
jgi:hypothetical protein